MKLETIFEKTDNEKILEKLDEIYKLTVPKIVYVPYPVYIEKEPWCYCEPEYFCGFHNYPQWTYAETYPAMRYGMDLAYTDVST